MKFMDLLDSHLFVFSKKPSLDLCRVHSRGFHITITIQGEPSVLRLKADRKASRT